MLALMAQFRTSRKFDVVFLLALAALLWLAIANRVAVGDWVYFLHYQPSAQTVKVADEAALSPLGRHLFYRTDPQFASLAEVNAACDVERLGCLTSHGTGYILDDPSQPDQTVVTAAHEMLHLAYRRLPSHEKDRLAPLIDQAIAANSVNGLADELSHETTAEDRRDEAHSLLGTEYSNLPDDLEAYYQQYFTDRAKVVAAEDRSRP
jgi:hypothetical protein